MKHLVEFPLEDGGTILVETNEWEEQGSSQRIARSTEDGPEHAPQTFEQALSNIRPATEKVMAALCGLLQRPDEIEMEFGFCLSAQAGVVITSVSTDANYKIILRWKGESKERPT
jgi:hypothetical protein